METHAHQQPSPVHAAALSPAHATASNGAEQAMIQMAIDVAAASAAVVLRDGEISDAGLARVKAGFSAKITELFGQTRGSTTSPPVPMAARASRRAPMPGESQSVIDRSQSGINRSQSGIDRAALTEVLADFMEADYARRLCEESNVQPMIGDPATTRLRRIALMFRTVRVDEATLVVELHQIFEQRSQKLLERFAKHLQARMPELERLKYEQKSPPSSRTIMLRAPTA